MSKDTTMMTRLVNAILCEVREKYPESIDKAYEYFWEGESPDEFMSGSALTLGFHNFEDWLICDYKANEEKETFIDLYLKNHTDLDSGERAFLLALKNTTLGLYEVISASKDRHVRLRDLFRETDVELRDKTLSNSLGKGDLFGARLVDYEGRKSMSSCVYPFSPDHKTAVLRFLKSSLHGTQKTKSRAVPMKSFSRITETCST